MTAAREKMAIGLAAALAGLAAMAVLSIMIGSKQIAVGTVFDALFRYDDARNDQVIVRELRVPRTLLGLAVGAALGLAGALIQALTRNPLADPGILGVNEGAALGVVLAVGLLGMSSPLSYVWFAFAGAAVAADRGYALGARSRSGATPVRLVFAGTAVTYLLYGVIQAIVLTDTNTFDRYRNWIVGSLASPDRGLLAALLP